MDIRHNVTINLSKEEVQEIIAIHLRNKGYIVKQNDVCLEVGTRCEGYGMDEHEVKYFKGCSVSCIQER